MTLEPRPHFSNAEKHAFYQSAAKRFKAELKLYGATAAIHLENKNDEVFWGKVLREAYPKGKFRFISASRSIGGNVTAGCTQCLQYRDFLDKHFWIAIDSDYRYLSEEPDIDAQHYILQTYTYSFENHFCYWKNCQRAFEVVSKRDDSAVTGINQKSQPTTSPLKFDFEKFFTSYSRIVYSLMVWQLYLQGVNADAFPKSVFHRLLSIPVGPKALEHDGASVLNILKERAHKLNKHLKQEYPEADPTWFEARCNAQGVHRDNCYLYVRGHQLYDLVMLMFHRAGPKFEKELTSELCFGQYEELQKIHDDILTIINKKQ